MGWRFRKSFTVIPGVRLNLSKSGLSASIGGGPFTLNVGPRGLMSTASVPGTGISYRKQIGYGALTHGGVSQPHEHFTSPPGAPATEPLQFPSPATLPSGAPIEEVRSASTERLTSDSLRELKHVIEMARTEHEDISNQLARARSERFTAIDKYRWWDSGYLFKRLFKKTYAERKEQAETATAKEAELEEQLRLTAVATEIEIDREQAEPFFRMRDDFAYLCGCAVIWDVRTHQATDKFHERTNADLTITRKPVSFSIDGCELVQWNQAVPHLRNSKGGEMFLYPGFIVYRAGLGAFSVLDYHDVTMEANGVNFQETEGVPRDSQVVAQVWAKANKNGSPDKRFANNYQIPVARYGALTLRSTSGLWEEFQFSDPNRLDQFSKSFGAFVSSFEKSAPSAA